MIHKNRGNRRWMDKRKRRNMIKVKFMILTMLKKQMAKLHKKVEEIM